MEVASAGLLDGDAGAVANPVDAGADGEPVDAGAAGEPVNAGPDAGFTADGAFGEWLPELHATSAPDNARHSRTAIRRCRAAACWPARLPMVAHRWASTAFSGLFGPSWLPSAVDPFLGHEESSWGTLG